MNLSSSAVLAVMVCAAAVPSVAQAFPNQIEYDYTSLLESITDGEPHPMTCKTRGTIRFVGDKVYFGSYEYFCDYSGFKPITRKDTGVIYPANSTVSFEISCFTPIGSTDPGCTETEWLPTGEAYSTPASEEIEMYSSYTLSSRITSAEVAVKYEADTNFKSGDYSSISHTSSEHIFLISGKNCDIEWIHRMKPSRLSSEIEARGRILSVTKCEVS